jgi:glycosyltransferase involved in cell wall biosynthesis
MTGTHGSRRPSSTNCELVVVDDGVDGVASVLPRDDRIRHVRVDGRRSVGALRNLACEHARGEFIAHWDDDDWMSDVRLAVQMRALAEAGGGAVSGLARLPFIDPARRRAWEYRFTGSRPWVAGGTLCYPRDVWQRQPFRDVREGEDTRFVWSLHSRCVVPVEADGLYVATVHAGNTSRKHTSGTQWHVRDYAEVRALLGHDAAFYDALREVPA